MMHFTTRIRLSAVAVASALFLVGCCGCDSGNDTNKDTNANAVPAASTSTFDINTLTPSAVALGAFPYLSLPEGYHVDSTFTDGFGYWVGERGEFIKGRTQAMAITHDTNHYHADDIATHVDGALTKLGAHKIFHGMIAKDAQQAFTEQLGELHLNLGDVAAHPVSTYLIRRSDGNVWAHLLQGNDHSKLIITHEGLNTEDAGADTATRAQPDTTAHITETVDSSVIQAEMASSGKISLQLNFATGKADILPESQAQIQEVVAFLNAHPDVKVAINGHTDNVGNPAHNQALSEERAKAMMAAITAQGIDAARLSAQGHGDQSPIADNTTAEGRAKNRRVELTQIK